MNDAYAGVYRAFFLSTAVQVLNAGSSIQQNISGSEYERRHLGYFGRVGYNYKEKYLAEFLWREDGSYIFPPNSRFGFFPGVSVGWRISEEGFFKNNVRFVDNLKFRASYGQVGAEPYLPGTTNLAEFQYLSSYNQGNIAFNGTVLPGLAEGVAPNNTFTWERQKNLNFGLDGTVLNNKLNFTVDVFSNRRDKALLPPLGTVPATAIPGSQLPPVNYGSLQNRGWEFSVDYHNTTFGGLKYSIGANAGYAQNKVLVFDEAPGVPDNQKQVGKPYQANVAFVYDGVFKDASEINGAMGTSSSGKQLDYSALVSTLRPGDMKFKDISGPNGKPDGVIDHYDQERLTKNTNFKMTYGITLNLQYKGFDASFLFQGATGGLADIYTESGLIGNFLASDYSHRWSIDNPSSVYPRLADRANTYYTDRSSGGSGGHNTYNLKSTNYLRLKNLEIGYTLPSTITRKAAINTLRFYVNATNLVTFSKMKDFDPEIYGGGNYLGQYYPQLRVISFGATVNF